VLLNEVNVISEQQGMVVVLVVVVGLVVGNVEQTECLK
jgi:hypothetical protein